MGAEDVLALGLAASPLNAGLDAALIETDGVQVKRRFGWLHADYPTSVVEALSVYQSAASGLEPGALSAQLTRLHADVAMQLLGQCGAVRPDAAGLQGHTVLHQPHRARTLQLGDGALLAQMLGLPVFWDMAASDLAAGGQGAPIESAYHKALVARRLAEGPHAVIVFGDVASASWIGVDGQACAMHCGPGLALLELWAQHCGRGAVKRPHAGAARTGIVAAMADNPYFDTPPPKALDRLDFDVSALRGLDYDIGMATLAAFVAECVWMAQTHFPAPVRHWWVCSDTVCGTLLKDCLNERLDLPIRSISVLGPNAGASQAEAYALLAVRAQKGLALGLPATTGARAGRQGARVSLP